MQRATFWASTLVLSLASIVNAQVAISARSGLVHYAEGDVLLEGNPVDPQPGHFPEIGVGQTLTAEQGRAEVLLTPGVFLRLAENSSRNSLCACKLANPSSKFARPACTASRPKPGLCVSIKAKPMCWCLAASWSSKVAVKPISERP
jgi:hypothetical protein